MSGGHGAGHCNDDGATSARRNQSAPDIASAPPDRPGVTVGSDDPLALLEMQSAVPQLAWTASAEGRLLYCNPDLLRLLGDRGCLGGFVEQYMQGSVVHDDDVSHWLRTWRRAVESGEAYEVEYRSRPGADGVSHWYLERGAQCECHDRADRWFVTATRIDCQKHREEELIRALQLRDRYFAMLLHELRNPLAPIATAAEALAGRPHDARLVNRTCAIIQRQLRQLTLLVEDLLDVSRISRGDFALHREWVDPVEIIDASIETARPIIDARSHRVTTQLRGAPKRLYVDAVRMRQVITNLLINAAKYTDPGGRIQIDFERTSREVLIRVRDNGIGLSGDLLPRIFDPFTQAVPGTQQSTGGMGVGLAVVRDLVRLHGGSICAFSEGQGRGSEFVVRLPAQEPVCLSS